MFVTNENRVTIVAGDERRPQAPGRVTWEDPGKARLCCDFMLSRSWLWSPGAKAYRHPKPEWTRFFALKRGTIDLRFEGGQAILGAGCLALLPSNLPFTVRYLSIDMKYFHLHLWGPSGLSYTHELRRVLWRRDPAMVERIHRAMDGGPDGVVQPLVVAEALDLLAPHREMLEAPDNRFGRFPGVVAKIREAAGRPVNTSVLAQAAGVSRETLSRDFRKRTGMTLRDYMDRERILQAKKLLSFSELPVVDVASHLGFSDRIHFHRFFKAHTGVAPGQFRLRSVAD